MAIQAINEYTYNKNHTPAEVYFKYILTFS